MKNKRAYLSDIKTTDAKINRVYTIHVDYSDKNRKELKYEINSETGCKVGRA